MSAMINNTPSTATKPLKLTSSSTSTSTSTSSQQTLPNGHLDYIFDIQFDYYGRRFATASSDRTVRVWDLNAEGIWDSNVPFEAHRGPIHSISWAHPEFGQLLATAGADHSVIIWEEREGGFNTLATPERSAAGFLDTNAATNNTGSAGEAAGSRWVSKATLSDARRAVSTVEFAPRHLGLRLASGSADGVVRIYEALDTMSLNHWKLEAEISNDDGSQRMGAPENTSSENMGVSSLSWCTGRFEPATLAVGMSSGRVSIYRYDDGQRSWLEALRLPGHATSSGVPRGVLHVSFAPNVGRSFHLIATCGKDNQLKVHRVKRSNANKAGDGDDGGNSSTLVYESTELLEQKSAWKCAWNVTGTVLSSSGDGRVSLWKSDFKGKWKCVSEIASATTGGQ